MTAIDVNYRIIEEDNSEVIKINNDEIKLLGLSKVQPKNVGYPYVMHVPASILLSIPENQLHQLAANGMWMKKGKPLFLKTELNYLRVSFKYGDAETALQAYELFKKHTRHVFKNWLD